MFPCCSLSSDTVNKYDVQYAICKLNYSALKKKTAHLTQRSTERDIAY